MNNGEAAVSGELRDPQSTLIERDIGYGDHAFDGALSVRLTR